MASRERAEAPEEPEARPGRTKSCSTRVTAAQRASSATYATRAFTAMPLWPYRSARRPQTGARRPGQERRHADEDPRPERRRFGPVDPELAHVQRQEGQDEGEAREDGEDHRHGHELVAASDRSWAPFTWPAPFTRPSAATRDSAPAAGVLAPRFVDVGTLRLLARRCACPPRLHSHASRDEVWRMLRASNHTSPIASGPVDRQARPALPFSSPAPVPPRRPDPAATTAGSGARAPRRRLARTRLGSSRSRGPCSAASFPAMARATARTRSGLGDPASGATSSGIHQLLPHEALPVAREQTLRRARSPRGPRPRPTTIVTRDAPGDDSTRQPVDRPERRSLELASPGRRRWRSRRQIGPFRAATDDRARYGTAMFSRRSIAEREIRAAVKLFGRRRRRGPGCLRPTPPGCPGGGGPRPSEHRHRDRSVGEQDGICRGSRRSWSPG